MHQLLKKLTMYVLFFSFVELMVLPSRPSSVKLGAGACSSTSRGAEGSGVRRPTWIASTTTKPTSTTAPLTAIHRMGRVTCAPRQEKPAPVRHRRARRSRAEAPRAFEQEQARA